jgi:8-oxo-dGTP pyrophosphatase MutT (NUDIX family)
MPRSLVEREIQHTGLTELHTVESMHERKSKMAELADGFMALPGGAGTLEEIFEQWTWAQLGIHGKPCGFLNTNGYFDPMRRMIEQMAGEGFLRLDHASMLVFGNDPGAMVDAFREYSAPAAKWPQRVIRIVAALVQDEARRVLLVRKKGTRAFMQPGGKLRDSESHLTALERELNEELKCSLRPDSAVFLGTFTAAAANENDCMVEAVLYAVDLVGSISAASEIEEVAWIHPNRPHHLELAPLTREHVLPLAARNGSVTWKHETASGS